VNEKDNATDNPYAATIVEDEKQFHGETWLAWLQRKALQVLLGIAFVAVAIGGMVATVSCSFGHEWVKGAGCLLLTIVLGAVCGVKLESLEYPRQVRRRD
jgi:hypothetical protein